MMHATCTKFLLATGIWLGMAFASAEAQLPGQSAEQAGYVSPYQFAASVSDPSVTFDFQRNPRNLDNFLNWSETPFRDWQNFRVIERLHSTWGPYYRPFPAPVDVERRPEEWLQRRIVAAAAQLRNTVPYGHHHMGQWCAPDGPEWRAAHYEPGYGIDCSDFTHFIYNYALGIQLKTGIGTQANLTEAPLRLADGREIRVVGRRLLDVQNGYQKTYADLVSKLRPGDLLYIRGNPGLENRITHVIMWLGPLAVDTNGKHPNLVTDSHGAVVHDSDGNLIPSGPEIRPFLENSYYYRSFDHIVRYVPLERL